MFDKFLQIDSGRSNNRFLLRFLLLVLVSGLFSPQGVQAGAKAEIRDIVVSNSSEDLLLYLQVEQAFKAEMVQGVLNGIPASFTFFVSLREIQDGRPSKQVASLEFDHVLSYDSLKEVFELRFSENKTSATVADLDKAKDMMTEVNGVKIVGLDQLQRDAEYFLSVKVRLERKTLPLFIHYLIPFWQLRDEETDWYYVEFRY